MKSCPACKRTFEDTFTFCLVDGSILSAPFDPEETAPPHEATEKAEPPTTQVLPGGDSQTEETRIAARQSPHQLTSSASPPVVAPAKPKRKSPIIIHWGQRPGLTRSKWLLLAVGGLVIGGVALLVLYFQPSVPINSQQGAERTSERNANDVSSSPKAHLRAELEQIVNQLHTALYAADAATVDRILSDEFVWYRTTGATFDRRKVMELATVASPEVLSCRITDFELVSDTNTAIANYTETLTYKDGQVIRDKVTANFVKRKEQWQIASLKFYK